MSKGISKIALLMALLALPQGFVFGQTALIKPATDADAVGSKVAEAPSGVPTDADAVIVTVDGKSLTMGKINWIKPNADAASVQQISDFWLTTQLLYAEAEKRQIPESPKMQFLAAFSAQQANGHELVRLVREEITVSEPDVEKAFSEKDSADPRTREQIKQGLVGMAQTEAANSFITELKAGATNRVEKSEFLIQMESVAGEQPRL